MVCGPILRGSSDGVVLDEVVKTWKRMNTTKPGLGKGAECLSGILCFAHALVAQWIEHQLAELRVGGSSPLERAFSFKRPLLSCAVADNSNATFDTLAGYI